MTTTLFFNIILIIIVADFALERILGYLNYTWYNKPIPQELSDVYDVNEYAKSQQYKQTNFKFGLLTSGLSFIMILAMLLFGGFGYLDDLVQLWSDNAIIQALAFFGILFIASDLINIPFSWYRTFVIEERFGFNKTTRKTFILDKIKGYAMTIILGGGLIALIVLCYNWAGDQFWWYVWILITVVSVFTNMFYSRLIVPFFNKQAPLESGSLREKITTYASSVGFALDKIFVIDGSKRSTKANAYFSGFGNEKRVTLYDTLMNDCSDEEITAILAHEVGHYKKKHIIYNLIAGILTTGITLFLFSLLVDNELLAQALGANQTSFHIGLVAFGLLYSPISTITGLLMSLLSRKFEYEADAYATKTYKSAPLISSLKQLSKTSLSNLTPHPAFVFFNYSHPTLLQRIQAMEKLQSI